MKIAGIVAEYNPFHNGHKYHIDKTRRATGADAIVVVMSGNFVQRGECAVADKWTRAHAALLGGADLVLEMPVYYSLGVARTFAFGAVSTLDALGCVDCLSFGTEADELRPLYELAQRLAYEDEGIKRETQKYLDGYTGYPAAQQKALVSLYGADETLFKTPNNMLAIENMRSLLVIGSKIRPIAIKRLASSYHDTKITSPYASAAAIRTSLGAGEDISLALPPEVAALYDKARQDGTFPVRCSDFDQMVISSLRRSNADELRDIFDMPHGMENRIIAMAKKTSTIDELTNLCCAKQFTRARIRRLLFASFLGIDNLGYEKQPSYVRVLGMNSTGQKVLSKMRGVCSLPVIVKAASYAAKDTDPLFLLDCKSTGLYCMAYKNSSLRKGGADFVTSPIIL